MGLLRRVLGWGAAIALLSLAIPAAAETVDEPLPFLADDASYPPGLAPSRILPERRYAQADGSILEEKRPETLPPQAPAFPDLAALLAPFRGAFEDRGNAIRVATDSAPQTRIQRLIAAVRAGYARDTRVEITIVRDGTTLLTFDRTTRSGALLIDDLREDSTWPAGVDASPVLVFPNPVVFRTGSRVSVMVTPDGGDRLVVDLELNVSRTSGERSFDDEALRRVAPIVDVVYVRAALPVVSGVPTELVFDGVRVVVRATRSPLPPPAGTRVLPLPRPRMGLRHATRVRPRRVPLLSADEDGGEWVRDDEVAGVPSAWTDAARRKGVRLTRVPPAIVIVDGEEPALALFDESLAAERSSRAHVATIDSEGLRLPIVEGRSFTIGMCRMIPVAVDADAEVQSHRANVVSHVDFDIAGRFAHGEWDGDELRVSLDTRSAASAVPAPQAPRTAESGGAPRDVALERVLLVSGNRAFRLGRSGDAESPASLTPVEGWR